MLYVLIYRHHTNSLTSWSQVNTIYHWGFQTLVSCLNKDISQQEKHFEVINWVAHSCWEPCSFLYCIVLKVIVRDKVVVFCVQSCVQVPVTEAHTEVMWSFYCVFVKQFLTYFIKLYVSLCLRMYMNNGIQPMITELFLFYVLIKYI